MISGEPEYKFSKTVPWSCPYVFLLFTCTFHLWKCTLGQHLIFNKHSLKTKLNYSRLAIDIPSLQTTVWPPTLPGVRVLSKVAFRKRTWKTNKCCVFGFPHSQLLCFNRHVNNRVFSLQTFKMRYFWSHCQNNSSKLLCDHCWQAMTQVYYGNMTCTKQIYVGTKATRTFP